MEEIPVIQIYLWGNLVGAMSWDDERGYADFQFDDRVFADVCIFSVPPPSLGIVSAPVIGGIHADYQLLIFTDGNFCVGK